jgi:environmental stress-induced protein Ves
VRLAVEGREVLLGRALQRFDFAGETPIACTLLGGACEDLNVMTARATTRADANVHELAARGPLAFDVAEQGLVVALRGAFTANGEIAVGEREALRVRGPCRCELTADAAGATLLVATFRSAGSRGR